MHHLGSRGARIAAAFVIFTAASSWSSLARARSFRVNEIPNGRSRSCQTCHETSNGVVFNGFGSDVRSFLVGDGPPQEKHVDWSGLFARDSDGDGVSNGAELGDPDGTWRIGDPDPGGFASAPGDPNNAAAVGGCGDGILGAAETCDSDQLRGATCENQNLGAGEMLCGLDCRLDTTSCDKSAKPDDDNSENLPDDEGGCSVGATPNPAGGSMGGSMDGLWVAAASVVAAGVVAARRRQRFSRSRT